MSTTSSEPDDERVAAALDAAFPDREIAEVGDAGISWNVGNRTVRVGFADGEAAFLKVATDGDGSRVVRERAVVDYVDAHCDVAVPTVLASSADDPVPYLATAPMSGQEFDAAWADWDRGERVTGLERVGATLAEVHSLAFDRHGRVVDGGADGLVLDAGSWTEVLVATIERKRDLAPCDRFDHLFDEVVAAVEASSGVLDCAPATLIHSDPAMPNLFWNDGAVGVVDWEIAHVGDPGRDFRRAYYQSIDPLDAPDEERLVGALHDGYRRRAGSLPDGLAERRPVYDAVWLLSTAGFFEKFVEYGDESRAELAAWLESEMERRLDRVR